MADTNTATYSVLDPAGMNTMLGYIKGTRETADGNTSAVSTLATQLIQSVSQISAVLGDIQTVLNKIDDDKADRPVSVQFILPSTASSWTSSGVQDYAMQIDLADTEFKPNCHVEVDISPTNMSLAVEAGFCPSCVVTDGHLAVLAKSVPSVDILVQVWITKGATTSAASAIGRVNVPSSGGASVPDGAQMLLVQQESGTSAASLEETESTLENCSHGVVS